MYFVNTIKRLWIIIWAISLVLTAKSTGISSEYSFLKDITSSKSASIDLTVPSAETFTVAEKEKWVYMSSVFAQDLNVSKTATQKIGSVIKDYDLLGAFTLGALAGLWIRGSFIAIYFGCNGFDSDFPEYCDDTLFIKDSLKFLFKDGENAYSSRLVTEASIILSVGVVMYISHLINVRVGKWLEDKPKQCLQVFTDFVSQFDKHKNQIPQALIPYFESLRKDISDNGSLTKIGADQAQKIVEGVVTTGAVLSAIQ